MGGPSLIQCFTRKNDVSFYMDFLPLVWIVDVESPSLGPGPLACLVVVNSSTEHGSDVLDHHNIHNLASKAPFTVRS